MRRITRPVGGNEHRPGHAVCMALKGRTVGTQGRVYAQRKPDTPCEFTLFLYTVKPPQMIAKARQVKVKCDPTAQPTPERIILWRWHEKV